MNPDWNNLSNDGIEQILNQTDKLIDCCNQKIKLLHEMQTLALMEKYRRQEIPRKVTCTFYDEELGSFEKCILEKKHKGSHISLEKFKKYEEAMNSKNESQK